MTGQQPHPILVWGAGRGKELDEGWVVDEGVDVRICRSVEPFG